MNSREPVDLAKMAVSLLLLCLVIGATTGLFYYMFDTTDAKIDDMEKATVSASMERLKELEHQYLNNTTNVDQYPLVTNVVSALTEFESGDLLYVSVKLTPSLTGGAEVTKTFTYTGVTLPSSLTVIASSTPIIDMSRELLPYSDCRCELYLTQVDPSTGAVTTSGGMTGVTVVPCKTSYGGK